MGMSLEEYLAGREACAHCESTGNEEVCVTSLLSREDSCIFYNAINKNGDPKDDSNIKLLQNFRSMFTEAEVLDYYVRASKVVRPMLELDGDQTAFWMEVTVKYVNPILEDLKNNNKSDAYNKIQVMLDELGKGIE